MNGDERPWEKYADPQSSPDVATSTERPWEKYADPTVPSIATTGAGERAPVQITVRPQGVEPQPGDTSGTPNGTGWWRGPLDFARSIPRGILGGLMEAGSAGAQAEAHAMSQPELAAEIPNKDEARQAIEANVTGPLPQPQGTWGQYGETLGEFAGSPANWIGPGGRIAKAVNTIAPALISETAGQLTKGQATEGPARAMGGVLGGLVGGKLVTPGRVATPAYQQAVDTLKREIPDLRLSAGERTNSGMMKIMESVAGEMPFSSGRAQDLNQAKAAAVNRYFTEKAFDPAALAAPSSTLPALRPGRSCPVSA